MQPWKVQLHAYLSGAWHYRWTGMAVAWIVCLVGWGALVFVPNQFEAVAKIYIDTDTMMAPLLRGLTVSTDPDQQVSVMLNTLLTRPNLEQVVRLTARPGTSFSSAELARQVKAIQSNISLRPLGTKNLYEISVVNNDPNKALSISQTLLSIFVDSNIGSKRKDFQGAQSFLDDKVAEYENLVRQAEQRRAAFRQANVDVLSNGVTPDQARAQAEKIRQDLGAAEARVASLRSQLGAIPKILYVDTPGPLIVSSGTGNNEAIGKGGSLFQRLAETKQTLIDLKSKYTDDYPDVKEAQREVKELQSELAALPPTGSAGSGNQSIPNPVYVQTQGKLADAMGDAAFQQQRYRDAMADMDRAEKSTSRAIEINTKFADLDRDYDLVHKTYQELLARRESARISQSVNDEQSAINVRVVEPPKKAPFPAAPNRPLINSIVLLAGLITGLAAAFALSINAGRFFAKEQLAAEFDYPIIGVVSRLSLLSDAIAARRAYSLMATSLAVLLCGYVGVLVVFDAAFRGTLRELL
ncbi:MAG TPA: XrtA system polysaccharide chain length determinant [Rhizomicrobium sp.]|jgi:polysaccharide chain length determinant protein (PEP-CTERM system associated)